MTSFVMPSKSKVEHIKYPIDFEIIASLAVRIVHVQSCMYSYIFLVDFDRIAILPMYGDHYS